MEDDSQKKPFIKMVDVHKSFGDQKVHRGINLEVYHGETICLIGGSGEGKSVLLKEILGLLPPDKGEIYIDKDEISGLDERALAPIRDKLGMLFQDGALFDSMSVAENVAFPLKQTGIKDEKILEEKVREALWVVDLGEHMSKMPVQLSGGMRKRVALARAIVSRPRCVLYDEPTSGLDPLVSGSIDMLIKKLQKQFKMTSIVVSHDMRSVFEISDRIAFLKDGKIHFIGTAGEVAESDDEHLNHYLHGRDELE